MYTYALSRSLFLSAVLLPIVVMQSCAFGQSYSKVDPPLQLSNFDIALSGHGALIFPVGPKHETVVPKGLELWVIAPPAASLANRLGKTLEDGTPIKTLGIQTAPPRGTTPSGYVPTIVKLNAITKYVAGEKAPNYLLFPPGKLQLGNGPPDGPNIIKIGDGQRGSSLEDLWKKVIEVSSGIHKPNGEPIRVFWLACTAMKGASNQVVVFD